MTRKEGVAHAHADGRLVVEEAVDPSGKKHLYFLFGVAERVRIGGGTQIPRQKIVLSAERVRMDLEAGRVRVADERRCVRPDEVAVRVARADEGILLWAHSGRIG